jgi:hypothetical protein
MERHERRVGLIAPFEPATIGGEGGPGFALVTP